MTERDVMRQELPDASLLICLFHVLRTFRREVSQDKLAISIVERTTSLDLLQGMAYATSPEAYERMYAEFCASVPQAVRTYFDRNWHGIRQEWVACHKRGHGNYMTDTNNRLESINQKLKAVVKRYSSMPVFFRDLMVCISSMKVERDHRALDLSTRVRQVDPAVDPALISYMRLLTPFAYKSLAAQHAKTEHVRIVRAEVDEQRLIVESGERELTAGTRHCQCGYR